MVKVLFVCMGNICRSPTAEGVFAKMVNDAGLNSSIETDSAGTHAYHVGNPPDQRAQDCALERGIDLSCLRARRVNAKDFKTFDYVLAMDNDNFKILEELCPSGFEDRLQLFLNYAPHLEINEVPDPYYGGRQGFERVLDMIEDASRGLLAHIKSKRGL